MQPLFSDGLGVSGQKNTCGMQIGAATLENNMVVP